MIVVLVDLLTQPKASFQALPLAAMQGIAVQPELRMSI